jgi:ppGpp synthetase/RelA/SpoT-type nucleotidyltranferase
MQQAKLCTYLPFEIHSRIKSRNSIYEKIHQRRCANVDDILGFRITHPFTANLERIANAICSILPIRRKIIAERGRVMYLLGHYVHVASRTVVPFEIQLWTSILYTVFATEHDSVYKPKQSISTSLSTTPDCNKDTKLNDVSIVNPQTDVKENSSLKLRELEHAIQDAIDGFLIHEPILQNQFFSP